MDQPASHRHRPPPPPALAAASGFTLAEMMIVLVILGVLAALGGGSLGAARSAAHAHAAARALYGAMLQAHAEAAADGRQRRIRCDATRCAYEVAAASGMAAPPSWLPEGVALDGGADVVVWAIDAATEVAATNPGAGPLAAPRSVTFFPDGTASAATVFVADRAGTTRRKVYVFAAAGMARVVDRW